jgi:hypothetical protein
MVALSDPALLVIGSHPAGQSEQLESVMVELAVWQRRDFSTLLIYCGKCHLRIGFCTSSDAQRRKR